MGVSHRSARSITIENASVAGNLTSSEREDSTGTLPKNREPAPAGINDAVRIIGVSDDTRAACTVGRAGTNLWTDPINTIIKSIVDDVTFFKLWIGLITEDDLADELKRSVW